MHKYYMMFQKDVCMLYCNTFCKFSVLFSKVATRLKSILVNAKASGYGRGETVTAVILERVCDAQRVHAHLIYASTNCDGYKSQGITYPSWKAQANLIDRCYQQASIDPTEMHFFECHGTGTEVGDMEEVKAIWSILGKNRPHSNKPLLLGSIKSNLGHCESASGLPSLIKCLLILKYKSIPPNLHYEQPSPRIPEFQNYLKV
uniref:Ketosynthase family 3 (KS3) domain-containing protein n=1 Tax=Tetranychus urticae TaxID=32264 RepID=T1KZN7_TETUR